MKEHPLQKIIESTLKSSDCDGLCNDKPCGCAIPDCVPACSAKQSPGDNEWATKVAKVHKQDGDSPCGGLVPAGDIEYVSMTEER